MKPFSLYHSDILDEKLIFWISVVYSLINGSCRSIFGILYDKFGIWIIRTFTILELAIGIAIYFTSDINWLFFILILVLSAVYSTATSNIPASITKVFGVDNSGEVFGIACIFAGLAALTSPILSKVLNLSKSKDDSPYLILFLVGAGLSLVAIVLSFTMNELPFDYESHHKKDIEEMINIYNNKINNRMKIQGRKLDHSMTINHHKEL